MELDFEKDTLDPHIIMGGENIQLRMKKERPILCERCLQFGHPKKYCRNDSELCTNCAEQLQEGRMHDCRELLPLLQRTTQDKKCEEYKMEATIQCKMRLDKYDVHSAKEILGYKGRKSFVSAAREEKQRGTEEETSLQLNYRKLKKKKNKNGKIPKRKEKK